MSDKNSLHNRMRTLNNQLFNEQVELRENNVLRNDENIEKNTKRIGISKIYIRYE